MEGAIYQSSIAGVAVSVTATAGKFWIDCLNCNNGQHQHISASNEYDSIQMAKALMYGMRDKIINKSFH